MSIDFAAIRDLLQKFNFAAVFREHLGWSRPAETAKWTSLATLGGGFDRRMIAELSGVAVFEVRAPGAAVPRHDGGRPSIPPAKERAKIHKAIGARHHEHLLIFVDDPARTRSLWSWVRRKSTMGPQAAPNPRAPLSRGDQRGEARAHYFFKGQAGDLFLGKLDSMVFDLAGVGPDGHAPILEAARKLRKAIDEERGHDQKSPGAHHLQPELTSYLCEEVIHRLVLDAVNEEGLPGGQARRFEDITDLLLNLDPELCWKLLEEVLPGLKLLDPACGSGAFLVTAAEELRELYGAVAGQAKVLPDTKLREHIAAWEKAHPSLGYFFKERILTHNLFGRGRAAGEEERCRRRLLLWLATSAEGAEDLGDFEAMHEHEAKTSPPGGFDAVLSDLSWAPSSPRGALHEVFMEHCYRRLRDAGQFALILPAAAYRGERGMELRRALFEACTLRAMHGFTERAPSTKLPLCSILGGKGGRTRAFAVDFDVTARERPRQRDHRRVMLTPDLVRRASPGSLTVMEIKSAPDVPIIEKMLRYPLLGENGEQTRGAGRGEAELVSGAWSVEIARGVSLKNLKQRPAGGPRGALDTRDSIQPYEWRRGGPPLAPRRGAEVHRLGSSSRGGGASYLLGVRGSPQARTGRTLTAALIPPHVVVSERILIVDLHPEHAGKATKATGKRARAGEMLFLLSLLNSLIIDWFVRMRVFDKHIHVSHLNHLPLPRLTGDDPRFSPLSLRAAKLTCTTPELDALAKEVGLKSHTAGETDPERRSALRAEIDGLVAHLYGLTEDEFVHVLASFPIVPEPQRVAAHNAYRDVARGRLP